MEFTALQLFANHGIFLRPGAGTKADFRAHPTSNMKNCLCPAAAR